MAVTTAVSDLFHSIYEVFASLLSTIYSLVNGVVNAVVSLITGFVTMITDIFGGLIDIAGGVGKFLAGNIVLLSVVAVGFVAYTRYTAHGRMVASDIKKKN